MKTDLKLKEDVLAELKWLPQIDESKIVVEVNEGIVILTGMVSDYSKKSLIDKAVKSIAGVIGIAEDIKVKRIESSKHSNEEIEKRIFHILNWNDSIPHENITIQVKDGLVLLTGQLEWEYQKEATKRIIENLEGVKEVVNSIQLYPKTTSDNVVKLIEDAFERSADIDASNIKVSIERNTATLTGTVKSLKEKDDAKRAVYAAPGITEVKNELKVEYSAIYM